MSFLKVQDTAVNFSLSPLLSPSGCPQFHQLESPGRQDRVEVRSRVLGSDGPGSLQDCATLNELLHVFKLQLLHTNNGGEISKVEESIAGDAPLRASGIQELLSTCWWHTKLQQGLKVAGLATRSPEFFSWADPHLSGHFRQNQMPRFLINKA